MFSEGDKPSLVKLYLWTFYDTLVDELYLERIKKE